MTNSDTLAALSEAATQGEWDFEPVTGYVATKTGPLTLYVVAELQSSNDDNGRFIVTLVNAYRTGQLVPVPSVERVARAICSAAGPCVKSGECVAMLAHGMQARAVIAAMQEGRDG